MPFITHYRHHVVKVTSISYLSPKKKIKKTTISLILFSMLKFFYASKIDDRDFLKYKNEFEINFKG